MATIAMQRLRNQQLEEQRFGTAAEIVAWLGAVQAQEYAGASWSLGLRLAGALEGDINRAFDAGELLRTHVLRPTWHFVSPADIRWLLALTSPRVHAANSYWYRKFELDAALLRLAAETIVDSLEGGRQLTRVELAPELERAGIVADGLRLSYIMMYAELEQLICSGQRRGKQFAYALLDERVPPAPPLERDAALAELSARYMASHGPALLQDFAWWSGLSIADARAGLQLAAPRLDSFQADGRTYYRAAGASPPLPGADTGYLLPLYDEYTIAYKEHSPILDASFSEQAQNASSGGTIMLAGRLLGGWKRTLGRGCVTVSVAPWRQLSAHENELLTAAAQRYAAFLGLGSDVTVQPL